MSARLYIVGAGPGDPDLITLKAIKVLEKAEVILYDALANKDLLTYAPDSCLKIYVGKRAGMHSRQQEEIQRMILDYAKCFEHIVRLKGGDPYVFGRGHEELEHASSYGLEVEVIPGVSSATAVPASAGIPLTKRGINESFWVVTGTLKDGGIPEDLYHAAQSRATVVVLMGLKKLKEIADLFRGIRGENEPIAIIQDGTKGSEKVLVGEVGDIVCRQEMSPMTSPAILVIGNVVRERNVSVRDWLASASICV
ncbi:uroporphyrinogen-III C-methyltransferase [Negadavirga shengliensis]|uniref:uroporphyrinogen-III C-methyltransferase n=1 Tax=Negadavirga shengliensis TaxID=1389218 RepID=A0ABV9T959_9BACT